MEKTLYIIRGLPGSGKTTLAKKLAPTCRFEADDFFIDENGEYDFDARLLRQAHHACWQGVRDAMKHDEPVIAVANTFTQMWEMVPYLEFAKEYGYTPNVIELLNSYGSIHDVPQENVVRMADRWESYNG